MRKISKNHRFKKISLLLAPLLLIVSIFSVAFTVDSFNKSETHAADVSKFNPGNIISDSVMSKKDTMSIAQIQSFLDSKNPCNNTNTYLASWYPQFQYHIVNGKFVCMAKESFNGKSAAQIIWEVAQRYSINPQVLIVLLEKEQGLVSDTWPNNVQYRTATGFGCPDTAPCNSQYYGLENQLNLAANLFRAVLNGGWSNYPVGNTFVQYHPNAGCGGTVINIQNRATSALYRYTPYQPNQAALNAGYGTGDGCSAYGNRNFWMLFNDWFGSTQQDYFQTLSSPRWMQIKNNTYKVSLFSNQTFGPLLKSGRQIYFPDKFYKNNQWYLRTQYSQSTGGMDGIPLRDLGEIPVQNITSKWMSIENGTRKIDPARQIQYENIKPMTAVKVTGSISVNGSNYYRTEWESNQNRNRFIPAKDLKEFKFFGLINPRTLYTKKDTFKVNVRTKERVQSVSKDSYIHFVKRITIDGVMYLQSENDIDTMNAIPMSDLEEINKLPFVSLDRPRTMKLKQNTYKRNLPDVSKFGPELISGREIYFPDKIIINGKWYLRTQYDKDNNHKSGLPLDELGEI